MVEDRDVVLLKHIVKYCEKISNTRKRFGDNESFFNSDEDYKSTIAFYYLQIGELVGKLTDNLKDNNDQIPWKDIKLFRNEIAHTYGSIKPKYLWNTCVTLIPKLHEYCINIIPDYVFKEISIEQLELLKKTNIAFKTATRSDKVIIKYNKSDEAAVMAAIMPPTNSLKQ